MPTKKPRINITVEQSVYDALNAYSSVSEQSMSKIISDMLGQLLPVFQSLTEAIDVAKKIESHARADMLNSLESVVVDSENLYLGLVGSVQGAVSALHAQGATAPQSVEGCGGDDLGQSNPPFTNRGVRSKNRGKNSQNSPSLWLAASKGELK
jgi:hypothetical protein